MKLLLFVFACVLVGARAQFFGSQSAQNIQNNQFASAAAGNRGGFDDGVGVGGGHASVHSGFTHMRAQGGGMFREKRQFFGSQQAKNIQNNQFASAGAGNRGGFDDGLGVGGGHASVHSGFTHMRAQGGGMFRQKRQFFGSQSADNIQNNQFASAGGVGSNGGFDGGFGGNRASVHSGFTHMRAQGGGMFREKRQFFGSQSASNIQNNQFGSANTGLGGGFNDGNGMGGGMFRQKRQNFFQSLSPLKIAEMSKQKAAFDKTKQ